MSAADLMSRRQTADALYNPPALVTSRPGRLFGEQAESYLQR